MRLKARIRKLEAEVEWLKTWGLLRACELQLKILEVERAMEAHEAARQAARQAAREVAPRAEVEAIDRAPPHPEEPSEARRLEGCEPPAYTPPDWQPEHMQVRPTQWRIRGPTDRDDWDDDDSEVGQAAIEYDPMAEFDEDADSS